MNAKTLLDLGLALAKATSTAVKECTAQRVNLGEKLDSINCSGDRQVALDKIVDDFIMDWLTQNVNFPLLVVSEETGVRHIGDDNPEYFLLLDPIDGSNNLRPWFTPAPVLGISLGIGSVTKLKSLKDERALLLAVNREIFSSNCYYALEGEGSSFCSDEIHCRIASSPKQDLSSPVIGMDLDLAAGVSPSVDALLSSRIITRRLGSSILDFCNVASGQYDAYISLGRRLKVTDVAQSAFLVRSAGGVFDRRVFVDGRPDAQLTESYLYSVIFEDPSLMSRIKFSVVCAGNQALYEKLLPMLEL